VLPLTGFEWNDLMYRLISGSGLVNGGLFEQWAYTVIHPSTATATLIQETSNANVLQGFYRQGPGNTVVGAKASVMATDTAWRPVLELVDSDMNVFNPYNLYSEYTGNAGPLSMTGAFIDVVQNPFQLLSDEGGIAKMPVIQSVAFVDMVRRPSNLTVVNPLVPVSMSFARV
jgi:hypothetical protein